MLWHLIDLESLFISQGFRRQIPLRFDPKGVLHSSNRSGKDKLMFKQNTSTDSDRVNLKITISDNPFRDRRRKSKSDCLRGRDYEMNKKLF